MQLEKEYRKTHREYTREYGREYFWRNRKRILENGRRYREVKKALSTGFGRSLDAINNRVKAWNLRQLPTDWREQRLRWDRLNAARVILIALAFLALVLSYRML